MLHAMLDIETLSTRPNAVIFEVGIALFDPTRPSADIDSVHCFAIPIDGAQEERDISSDTLLFWSGQDMFAEKLEASRRASYEWTENQIVSLLRPAAAVWGYGSDFDNVILRSYLTDCAGFEDNELWPYYKNRCFRTLVNLYDPTKMLRPKKNDHDAARDALNQAKWMLRIIDRFDLSALFEDT